MSPAWNLDLTKSATVTGRAKAAIKFYWIFGRYLAKMNFLSRAACSGAGIWK
jgi:hypothetical protein